MRELLLLLLVISVSKIHGTLSEEGTSADAFNKKIIVDHREQHKKRCPRIKSLDFSKLRVHGIQGNFIRDDCLWNLKILGDEIDFISEDAFRGVPHLQMLNITANKLKLDGFFNFGYPESLLELHYVSKTGANRNYSLIIDVPKNMTRLEYLTLKRMDMSFLTQSWLSNFPRLIDLDASGNPIDVETFFEYLPEKLVKLNLDDCNIDKMGGENYIWLKNLQSLSLNENGLRKVVNHIETASDGELNLCYASPNRLSKLYLSGNDIIEIDNNAFEDVSGLEKLDLSHNRIWSISDESLSHLTQLYTLNLGMNPMKRLPDFSQLDNLSWLYLDGIKNPLLFRPGPIWNLKKLYRLSIANNHLERIPANFFENMPELKELILSNNYISIIDLKKLPNLQKLKLDNTLVNSFKSIRVNELAHLNQLCLGNIAGKDEILDHYEYGCPKGTQEKSSEFAEFKATETPRIWPKV